MLSVKCFLITIWIGRSPRVGCLGWSDWIELVGHRVGKFALTQSLSHTHTHTWTMLRNMMDATHLIGLGGACHSYSHMDDAALLHNMVDATYMIGSGRAYRSWTMLRNMVDVTLWLDWVRHVVHTRTWTWSMLRIWLGWVGKWFM